jgi:hypothetical protein
MGLLVADCPRCGAKHTTFDVVAQTWVSREFSWQDSYEIYCKRRQYHLPTTFLVVASGTEAKNLFSKGDGLATYHSGLNEYFKIERFVSIRDVFSTPPPEHLPAAIKNAFLEGAACRSIECFNAAATMFRPDSHDGRKLHSRTFGECDRFYGRALV